jgi:hypothetical protein
MKQKRLLLFPFLFALSGGFAGTALAGPPFHTDDPQPVDFRHWEAYVFSTLDRTKDGRATQGPALEFNWGVVRNVQLHLEFPLASSTPSGGPTSLGAGDVEMGVKYRFIQEGSHRPQVGIFPMLELPTGNARRGLGNGRVWARLPLWAQKSYGPWTTYGGGGYIVNQAPGMRSHALGGWLLQRDLGKRLTLGGELYVEGASGVGARSSTLLDLGGYYNFTPHFSFLFSLGRNPVGAPHTVAYFGLYWTWGGHADRGARTFPSNLLGV